MLQPHHFSFRCPLQLSDLDKTEVGYYCSQCRKDIYDLSDCSLDEIRDLQKRKGAICGFVRVVGVSSMMSIAACSKTEHADHTADPETPPIEQRIEMGEICVPPPELKPAPGPTPQPAPAPQAEE